MNIVLRQIDFRLDGIFGELLTEELVPICKSLEHGYENERGEIVSKIKPGVYTCQWTFSQRLQKFTYEVMNVPGHTGIRFHSANIDDQLEGCVAPGEAYGEWTDGSRCVVKSKQALQAFESMQAGGTEFKLIVESMNSGNSKKARDFDKALYRSQQVSSGDSKLLHNAL